MFCSISGEVPENPVVSLKSGHIYERRLIERYVAEHGSCPITMQPMSVADLLPVHINPASKPRPPSATSVPSLLHMLQSEWDSLMLETFSLKKQLDSVRKELSDALFQHEAACRVISRLVRERDGSKHGISSTPNNTNSKPGSKIDQPSVQGKLPQEIIEKVELSALELSKGRKKRAMPEDLISLEQFGEYKELSTDAYHGPEIIKTLDVHPDSSKVLIGCSDKHVKLLQFGHKKTLSSFSAHHDGVNQVLFHPNGNLALSCSSDKSVCILEYPNSTLSVKQQLHLHDAAVTGISIHPTGDYAISASADKTWGFIDLGTAQLIDKVECAIDEDDANGISHIQFHPDGLIFGTANRNVLRIWDLKTQQNVMTFRGHSSALKALSFSENGYYLATGAEDHLVKLWDLRKLQNIYTIDLGSKCSVNAIDFDYAGHALAIGGSELKIVQSKQWSELRSFELESPISSFKFSRNARNLVSACADNSLRYFGLG